MSILSFNIAMAAVSLSGAVFAFVYFVKAQNANIETADKCKDLLKEIEKRRVFIQRIEWEAQASKFGWSFSRDKQAARWNRDHTSFDYIY